MAILSLGSSVKLLLLSAAALSAALAFKLSLPFMQDLIFSVLPQIWSSLLSWLTPPYLYFVINGIIISIAVSFKFHHNKAEEAAEAAHAKISVDFRHDFDVSLFNDAVVLKRPAEMRPKFQVPPAAPEYGASVEMEYAAPAAEAAISDASKEAKEEEFVIRRSDWEPKRRDSTEYLLPAEKPLVSVRMGHRKSVKPKSVKPIPEGHKALGVAKPKRHETLESTWKTITEGRAMPLTRHLKKYDAWETHRPQRAEGGQGGPPETKKSDTMKEHVASPSLSSSPSPSQASGKLLRKESSLSQDELNRRVEAFIKKFNEEMRLQRQESLNHYLDMVKRGSH